MKTQEELKYELFDQISEIENALIKLDKAQLILGHWTDEYSFAKKPDPVEAVKRVTSNSREKSIHGEQSCRWFYEYSQIIGLIDIAFDYVFESKKILEKAAYGEKGA